MKTTFHRFRRPAALLLALAVFAIPVAAPAAAQPQPRPAGKPTVEEARQFIQRVEETLLPLSIEAGRAAWVQANFITEDTVLLAANRAEVVLNAAVELAQEASRFDDLELPSDLRRQIDLVKRGLTLPAPNDPAKTAELAKIAATLDSLYGSGKYCPEGGECKSLNELEDVIETSRDPRELLEVWVGWRTVSPPMKAQYQRLVEIANEGSRELGYPDTGALWRSTYDMPPDDFAREVDRLWGQVKPLYDALHCYVRAGLNEQYGDQLVPLDRAIPAHLLGNMWAQSWNNVYDLMAPPDADPGYDLTERLEAKGLTPVEMVKIGERFFTSLGFDPLPETFWERSLFTKPEDREVVCHASAWSLDYQDDLRIKMCIEIDDEDFSTIHHELGHNFYQRAYNRQPLLYQGSANDGFHEALGDAVALSITPEYLKEIGLIDEVPPASKDLGLLMKQALDKVAFLPFGLLVDKWRWDVFSGATPPGEYNAAWWRLREQYQGVRAPVERTEEHFDPGAKYHIPGNTPYMRYFLAHILQYQLHRGLCQAAGDDGPLHRCSIYGSREAGEKLKKMTEMGLSRPWPEALEAVTGQREMDATAILDYFAPLKAFLDEQNRGRQCGW
jgi:peptidyl-dipeptidase A